jgi:hypothetical protein
MDQKKTDNSQSEGKSSLKVFNFTENQPSVWHHEGINEIRKTTCSYSPSPQPSGSI